MSLAKTHNLKIANTLFVKKTQWKWTWESPDGRTKNEIDHFLINDARIVCNSEILSRFKFSSDHRIGRCRLKIPNRAKFKNYYKMKPKGKTIIPLHKKQEALDSLSKELNSEEEAQGIQCKYNKIEKAIKNTLNKYGKRKTTENTDDKLCTETKKLIEKRTELRNKKDKNITDYINLTEINKLVRWEI